jgi:DNA-binding CsgD family transcriptional regulator
VAIWAVGHASLAAGEHAKADAYLGPLCEFLLDAGIREPGEIRALGDEIEALTNLGRTAQATRLAERLERMAVATRRRSVLGTAHRSRAIIAAANGDVATALVRAERAVRNHAAAELPLELARSLIVLGSTQRRMRLKRAARESLERASEVLDRIGADRWSKVAAAEAARVGGRNRATSELTPAERRAAELVKDGKTNKEIAALMYVSPKTVEANLSRVYAKLGVSSRTELVRYLADRGSEDVGTSLIPTAN